MSIEGIESSKSPEEYHKATRIIVMPAGRMKKSLKDEKILPVFPLINEKKIYAWY